MIYGIGMFNILNRLACLKLSAINQLQNYVIWCTYVLCGYAATSHSEAMLENGFEEPEFWCVFA